MPEYCCPYVGCKHAPYVQPKSYQTHLEKCKFRPVDDELVQSAPAAIVDEVLLPEEDEASPLLPPALAYVPTVPETSTNTLSDDLQFYRCNTVLVRRIPKAARHHTALALAGAIDDIIKSNTHKSWAKLLMFAYTCFSLPDRDASKFGQSLTTIVKDALSRTEPVITTRKRPKIPTNIPASDYAVKRAVENKLLDGDITGAVRLLVSEDGVAPMTDEILVSLQNKHPPSFSNANFPPAPIFGLAPAPSSTSSRNSGAASKSTSTRGPTLAPVFEPVQLPVSNASCLDVTIEEVHAAICSFPNGSAGGIDGLRPQHLKDMVRAMSDETSKKLCRSIAGLASLMLSGNVPVEICPILYGAALTPLTKKDGGIRPIAVGNTIRRLVGKIVSRRVMASMGQMLRPRQLGYGTPGGAEAAVHVSRAALAIDHDEPWLMIKLDFRNAFNTVRRDVMLVEVRTHLPAYYPFVWQMYRDDSTLFCGDRRLTSSTGVQQGDPLGPLLFCLTIHTLVTSLRSDLGIWYLDDGTLIGRKSDVLHDLDTVRASAAQLGLELNEAKCEIFNLGGDILGDDVSPSAHAFKTVSETNLTLLGAPLLDASIAPVLAEKAEQLELMGQRLLLLNAHQALFLLKNCFAMPKLLYVLRCAPTWRFIPALERFDDTVKNALCALANVELNDACWAQATLPVASGGVGIRRASELALPAYLASVHSVRPLMSLLLPGLELDTVSAQPAQIWSTVTSAELPAPENRCAQKAWDSPMVECNYRSLFDCSGRVDRARLLAASTKESGEWLQALPVSVFGTLLDNVTLRVSLALRIGAKILGAHECSCGAMAGEFGHHGLSCRFSAGRRSRHEALNQVVKRALVQAGTPAQLEHKGLAFNDETRPDGMTFTPWRCGKQLIWDATCVDTFAATYIMKTSVESGAAAEIAETRKRVKYASLEKDFELVPLAFETGGSWGAAAKTFLAELGKRIIQQTGEARSAQYLRQRISIELQRGNAASILGTLPSSSGLDEVYSLYDRGHNVGY